MDKVAIFKEHMMEKAAQAKWRQLLDSKETRSELSNAFSHFNRNSKAMAWGGPADSVDLEDTTQGINELRDKMKRYISNSNKKQFPWKDSLSKLDDKNKQIRKDSLARRTADKAELNNEAKKSMDINDDGYNPEDYVNIIHGTNKSKAEAFLRGGNAPSRTDVPMHLEDGTKTDMGIMVHNRVRDRADGYAKQQSMIRGGDPAIMEGRIKRKYLYRNPSVNSGFGDEYAIPTQHYDKIENASIRGSY